MTRQFCRSALLCVLVLLCSACALRAQSYNPATQFSLSSNPNGVWSYGYAGTPGGSFTFFDLTCVGCVSGPGPSWFSSLVNNGMSPAIAYNNGPAYNSPNVSVAANQLDLVAGYLNGRTTELIFTAPTAGRYSLLGDFTGDQWGIGTNVGILDNGGLIYNNSVTAKGQIDPFSESVNLAAGEQLIFFVSPAGGSQNTGFDLNITSVPEGGSSILYLLLALAAILPAFAFNPKAALRS